MIEIIWAVSEHLPTSAQEWWHFICVAITYLCFSPCLSFPFLVFLWIVAGEFTTSSSLSNDDSLCGADYPTTTKAIVREASSDDDTSSSCSSLQQLPEELCQHIFSYLNVQDLCRCTSLVNRNFYHRSVHDVFWEYHTKQQWQGKQNIQRFLLPSDLSWKQRFAWSHVDSKRNVIRREEMTYFQWILLYHGQQCKLGLHQFLPDGMYNSLYEGTHEWMIQQNHLKFMGVSLQIERNPKDWGWIIGRGSRTEYHSIEPLPSPQEEES